MLKPVVETKYPYRADVVGSLLRPQTILQARVDREQGKITAEQLHAIEGKELASAVELQRSVGLKVCTDGDFHRRHWFIDFVERIDGVAFAGGLPARSHNEQGDIEFSPPRIEVRSKLNRSRSLAAHDFAALKPVADAAGITAKQCIPSPTLLHFRGGRAAVDQKSYPDMEGFFADLARVYREEIAALYAAGCRYVQIDETNLPFMCDPNLQGHLKNIGETRDALVSKYITLINDCVRDVPADMAVTMHMCRGNHESSWVADGGYDPIAEAAFGGLNLRGFFLEYDSPRAGTFAPLRYLNAGKVAVLGLVTSKRAEIENKDDIKRRIDEAAKVVPLAQLALSPQCGFASTIKGNRLTVDDEKRKLALVVETAKEVWGTA
jgi:5-methyltetrahydropteroyltriglutamate--homocysteine methyltransferase